MAGLLAVAIAAVAAALAARPGAPAAAEGGITFSDHGVKEVRGQAEIELEADNHYFKPTFLQGAPGQKLKLEIENESRSRHNISIPDQGIDRDIPPKGKIEIDVTFPPSGKVLFSCKYHRKRGMNGELRTGGS